MVVVVGIDVAVLVVAVVEVVSVKEKCSRKCTRNTKVHSSRFDKLLLMNNVGENSRARSTILSRSTQKKHPTTTEQKASRAADSSIMSVQKVGKSQFLCCFYRSRNVSRLLIIQHARETPNQ